MADNSSNLNLVDDQLVTAKPLNHFNYLNLTGYIINCIITFGASAIFGTPSNPDISEDYQTIITPVAWSFSIWGIIFISQGIFTIAQLHKKFRSSLLVQQGVGYWFFAACISQCGWTIFFSYEIMWVSLLMMVLIEASLVYLILSQYAVTDEIQQTVVEYFVFRFPFLIHCGWITAATFLNLSVVLVYEDSTEGVQTAFAIISLFAIAVSSIVLLFVKGPEFVIPLVLSWALLGIFAELSNPKDSIEELFSENTINGIKYASLGICITTVILVIIRMIVLFKLYQ